MGSSIGTGCGDDSMPPPPVQPEILDVQATLPMTQGTELRVSTANLDAAGSNPRLRVLAGTRAPFNLDPVTPFTEGVVRFRLTSELVSVLGEGRHDVELVLAGSLVQSDPYDFTLDIRFDIPIALTRVPNGSVHRNEEAIVEGEGFLEVAEGTVLARFDGTFVPEAGGSRTVNIALPVLPAEDGTRTRGVVLLTTAIGGSEPGTFDGSISLESAIAATGAITNSTSLSTTLNFQPPVIFEVTPTNITLEQLVRVRGAGFLGEGDEVTLLRATGTLTPTGGSGFPVGPAELVLGYRSGAELVGPLSGVVVDDILVSELFGIREGSFEGTVIPITISGGTEVAGTAAPITLNLGPVRQVIWVRFLPGFYDSLARFGLSAATGTLEGLVEERIEGIYADWNLDVRLDEPDDYSPQGYSVVEVGGPDPNGRGLFGYDNTPGKDVGNIRLFDAIGGSNAETQMDGFPGYGGVFVESFFGFSEHPPDDLSGPGGPDPDPLFDEIFDSVRDRAASLAEVRGDGERSNDVMRAVFGLSSIIGETTAHEVGHSLGLASPFGSRTVFHNPGNEPGCLMDSGSSRPLGERAGEPGFSTTHICGDGPEYLDEILPRTR